MLNQTGPTAKAFFDLKDMNVEEESKSGDSALKQEVSDWSTNSTIATQAMGPVLDSILYGEDASSWLCVAGLARDSALYQLTQGISTLSDYHPDTSIVEGTLNLGGEGDDKLKISNVWFLAPNTALVQFVNTSSEVLLHISDDLTHVE